jgi:hypothetical protein
MKIKLQPYNKLNYIVKTYFGKKEMLTETKLITYNTAARATLKYGSQS